MKELLELKENIEKKIKKLENKAHLRTDLESLDLNQNRNFLNLINIIYDLNGTK